QTSGFVRPARGKQIDRRRKRQAQYLPGMAQERDLFGAAVQVVDLDGAIARARCQKPAILEEDNAVNAVAVPFQGQRGLLVRFSRRLLSKSPVRAGRNKQQSGKKPAGAKRENKVLHDSSPP